MSSIPSPFRILTDEEPDFLLDDMLEHMKEMKNISQAGEKDWSHPPR
jgi:hypothetical protein